MSRVIIVPIENATEECLERNTFTGQEVWCMLKECSQVLECLGDVDIRCVEYPL